MKKKSSSQSNEDDYKKEEEDSSNHYCDPSVAMKIKDDEEAALTGTATIYQLNLERRHLLSRLLDLKGNICVFCRIRPTRKGEKSSAVVVLDSSSLLLNFAVNKTKIYSFNKVFRPASSQDDIFGEIEPVIKSTLDGHNACIFAYGQTGTGKTFTMEGNAHDPGIIHQTMEALFKQAAADSHRKFLYTFSMLEIYMGCLKDLLLPHQTPTPADFLPPCLTIQTDPKGEIKINNLVAIQVRDFNQAKKLYKFGCHVRSTASTNSNKSSSRSHCMIRILITCFDATEKQRLTNKIWMVDLGGSERVLKTKAQGRRLEEGKAINLSLSALGDVISALQRKKCHIPYRNGKLTQVLKDSLGENSKTLMLVHISPKEEDLCETVCSLNFATHVRSIHLGNEESTEAKAQKEVEIANLQQRMKWIEDKNDEIRREINKLNDKLEDLTETSPCSSKKLGAPHLCFGLEAPYSNIERAKNITVAPPSELPRFMKPTICSKRKSSIDHQTSEVEHCGPARSRSLLSHHAKSVTLPILDRSEYNSQSSVSRASCLMGSKLKYSSDDETEDGEDKSECDIKIAVFPMQDKASSANQKQAHLSCSKELGSIMHKFNSIKVSKIDDWLHSHKNAYGTSSHTQRSKRVLAIPCPEKNSRGHLQRAPKQTHECKVYDYNLSNKQITLIDVTKQARVEAARSSKAELVANIFPTVSNDFSNEDCRFSLVSPTHANEGMLMKQAQSRADELSIEEYSCSTSSAPEWSDVLNKDESADSTVSMQLLAYETQLLEDLILDNSWLSIHSASDDMCVSISKSKQKSPHQKMLTEIGKIHEEQRVGISCRHSEEEKLQQQNFLVEKTSQVDIGLSVFHSQEKSNCPGIYDLLRQKIHILFTCALLGVGFKSIGLEHDFFYALML